MAEMFYDDDADLQSDAREFGTLGRPHGQRLDVVAASGEQPRDAREDARLVLDQNTQCVSTHRISSSQSGARSRAILMSSLLVPAATMGHTIASLWQTNSTTTG